MKMKKLNLLFLLLFFYTFNSYATDISSLATGDWSAPGTWVGGVAPASTDNAIILSGHTVTLTADASITNITINAGGTLATGSFTLTVSGNFTNNGVFTCGAGANEGVKFTGSSAQTINGYTHFYNLTIDKTTNDVTLNASVTVDKLLTLTAGNIITGTNSIIFNSTATSPTEISTSRIKGTAIMACRAVTTNDFPNFLGVAIAAGDDIGNVTITRVTEVAGSITTVSSNQSIKCYWDINVSANPATARNVTFSWLSDLDNHFDTQNDFANIPANVWRKSEGESVWTGMGTQNTQCPPPCIRSITIPTTSFGPIAAAPTGVTANASATTLCEGSPLTLTGSATGITAATTWSWTGPCGYTSNLQSPTITNTIASTGAYTLTASNGCSSGTQVSTDIVTVNTNPTLSGGAASVCVGSTTAAFTGSITPGTWASSNSSLATVSTGGVVSGVATGTPIITYTVTATNCIATTSVIVNATPPIVGYTASPSPPTVCGGLSVTLSGTGATTYTWSGGITNGVSFVPSATTTYTVTGTSSGCTGTASVLVTRNPNIGDTYAGGIVYKVGANCATGNVVTASETTGGYVVACCGSISGTSCGGKGNEPTGESSQTWKLAPISDYSGYLEGMKVQLGLQTPLPYYTIEYWIDGNNWVHRELWDRRSGTGVRTDMLPTDITANWAGGKISYRCVRAFP